MDEATIRQSIRTYILNELLREPDYDLSGNEGLITELYMDSFALAELGVFIEREFDVYIPDPDLTVKKMDTLDLIVARVMRALD